MWNFTGIVLCQPVTEVVCQANIVSSLRVKGFQNVNITKACHGLARLRPSGFGAAAFAKRG